MNSALPPATSLRARPPRANPRSNARGLAIAAGRPQSPARADRRAEAPPPPPCRLRRSDDESIGGHKSDSDWRRSNPSRPGFQAAPSARSFPDQRRAR
jgi:hypothetical protein